MNLHTQINAACKFDHDRYLKAYMIEDQYSYSNRTSGELILMIKLSLLFVLGYPVNDKSLHKRKLLQFSWIFNELFSLLIDFAVKSFPNIMTNPIKPQLFFLCNFCCLWYIKLYILSLVWACMRTL